MKCKPLPLGSAKYVAKNYGQDKVLIIAYNKSQNLSQIMIFDGNVGLS